MAPRSGGALRCHALCPVLLRNCKFTLGVTSRSVSVQRRVELAPSPDEFVINPREADFFTVCVFAMRFGERLMCLVSLAAKEPSWQGVWESKLQEHQTGLSGSGL